MVTWLPSTPQVVLTQEQIQHRVLDLARQINSDYRGKTLHAVCILEEGFMFMADLVRHLEMTVKCQFVKPVIHQVQQGDAVTTEIMYGPEVDVKGGHILLVTGILDTGITAEFLIRNFTARGAVSCRIATLLDRHSARHVMLQPDYFGFLVDEGYLCGYGLGGPETGRNLPHVVSLPSLAARQGAT